MNKLITKNTRIGAFLILFLICAVILIAPARAAPNLQPTPFPTPTPAPDGRIIYIVQEGDTLARISAISGVSVEQIKALNNLSSDIITLNQPLLLGLAGPSIPTTEPGQQLPTPTAPPSPTPSIDSGTMCILLFDDINGDALRDDTEPPIAGGAISISSRDGETSLTAETRIQYDEDGLAIPECFENLPSGDYNITIAAPEGYNPTTLMNYSLALAAGDETYLDFGAQANSETLSDISAEETTSGGSATILGIAGIVLVLGGIGLGIYAFRLRQ
jgi:LysM repeat protein